MNHQPKKHRFHGSHHGHQAHSQVQPAQQASALPADVIDLISRAALIGNNDAALTSNLIALRNAGRAIQARLNGQPHYKGNRHA